MRAAIPTKHHDAAEAWLRQHLALWPSRPCFGPHPFVSVGWSEHWANVGSRYTVSDGDTTPSNVIPGVVGCIAFLLWPFFANIFCHADNLRIACAAWRFRHPVNAAHCRQPWWRLI